MNWLDIAIIAVAAISAIQGLWKGAIRAVFSVAGLLGGIALAGRYYQPFATILSPSRAIWSPIVAYIIILVAVLVVVSIIGQLVSKLAHIAMLTWLDRLIGFILGAGIGSMLCATVLAIVSKYLPGAEAVITQSVVARFLMEQFPLLLALLPKEFDFIHDLFS